MTTERPIIGRAERVDIPELGMSQIAAKIDTGAYSSSIDCEYFKLVVDADGKETLEFIPLRKSRPQYTGELLRTTDFERTEVTNSNGQQERFVIFSTVQLQGFDVRARLTLADRSKLRYPVLLGRHFISAKGFLVDVLQGEGLPGDEEERGL